ncbi:MAG: CDP-glycerol glycerophosphotransferase family protein [Leucobacter sp.]|nr:CDP-glycerol glycerophosphotransferase family protein [Leucobacter sp.]
MKKIRKYARRLKLAVQAERIARQRHRAIRPDTVFYESFAGNGVLCNPEAIFRYLLDHPDFAHLKHVWSISDSAAAHRFRAELGRHPRVGFARTGSGRYWAALSTSGFVINNATFPPAFGKRDGQVYVNTWHGTPLKLMGFDMPGGALQTSNTLRNFLMADYLLAANPFMSERMYEQAYRLHNVYGGRIIEEGYPRLDRQFASSTSSAALEAELEAAGLRVTGKRIVLFAPTWRGASFSAPEADLDALDLQVRDMQRALGPDAVVLLKTHQVVHAPAAHHPSLGRVLVPNTIPTNRLLGVAHALVTDYSSIFFDFLATGRPIVFFAPDASGYEDQRGTYFSPDELPGPVVGDPVAAGEAVRDLLAESDLGARHPRYDAWAQRFTPHDDGNATARVVDVVFRGREDGYRVRTTARDGKRRLLFFLGGMRSNGITSSALNLLDRLDYERYDVTALIPNIKTPDARANQQRIDPRVRVIARLGGMNGSKVLHLGRRMRDLAEAPPLPGESRLHGNLWRDEWRRVLGSAEFDWLGELSGYNPFWANLLLSSPDAPRAIWLHSEMARDRRRTVDGRRPMERDLGYVFSRYRAYDLLVSVSPALTELNRQELSDYADPGKFTTVRNFPSPSMMPADHHDPRELLEEDESEPRWMAELLEPERKTRWFITVGRLSPEKDHARLIRAFAEVHATAPQTRLLIVGGGPLEADLQRRINAAGLGSAAYLAGPRRMPVALLAAADCFVLSSRYEGQPMVLLEAALCGLPIVSTTFASAAGALPGDTIHLVDQSDAALRDGMLAFLAGDVPPSHLDFNAYVSEVMRELELVLDFEPAPRAVAP